MTSPTRARALRAWPLPGKVILFLALITLFRLWFCTRLELVGDEAYYWLWSRHLDFGYFSKGPGVAWTIALGTALFGDTVFGIRFFSVLLAAGTSALLYILARALVSDAVALACVLLGSIIPLFAVGSILMTIDPLSVFFWAVAAVLFWRAKDEASLTWWIATGGAMGLGTLCKYTNAAQIVCFALFCVWCQEYRHHFRKATFPALLITALLALTPVLIWNYQHDWITFQHLAHRGGLDRSWRFSPWKFLQFLIEQSAVLSPLFFAGTLIALFWPKASGDRSREFRYLLSLFLPLFVFYSILSFNDSGQPNWTAPCYVGGMIILVSQWSGPVRQKPWARRMAVVAVLLALAETLLLHDTFWLNLPPRRDPLSRMRGSEDLARQVAAVQAEHGAQFIIANKYGYASLLSFYHPQRPQTFLPHSRSIENQFSFWPSYAEKFSRQSALFISDSEELPVQLQTEFASVQRIKETDARHRGRPIKKFYFTLCRDLKERSQE